MNDTKNISTFDGEGKVSKNPKVIITCHPCDSVFTNNK